jgi:succinoglycan biosynthesis protein ExoU
MRDVEDTVCIIIAAYNAADTISRSVESALQDQTVSEIVVVDDASTDSTSDLVRAIASNNSRVKLITFAANKGPSEARNIGIESTTAAWIGILDADDYFLQNRNSKLLAYAKDFDFVADDLWQVKEGEPPKYDLTLSNGTILSQCKLSLRDFISGNIPSGTRLRGELGFLKPLMRREFLRQHLMAYQPNMRLGEDYELYARALAYGAKFTVVPPQGYVSVWREGSLSGRHSETDLLNLRDCDLSISNLPSVSESDRAMLMRHFNAVDCKLQWRYVISAVKEKNWIAIPICFGRSWGVACYLFGQLCLEFVKRTLRICFR